MKLPILPARSGSTRIKDKNVIDFCGQPMIAYPSRLHLGSFADNAIDSGPLLNLTQWLGGIADDVQRDLVITRHSSRFPDHRGAPHQ